jgi:hypothetical protein
MFKHFQPLRLIVLLVMLLLTSVASGFSSAQADTSARSAFHDEMRRLWEDHIVWTRMYIISAIEELPDTDFVAQRLLDNQTHIGDAIKPFYGDQAGEELTLLLRGHILGAVDLLDAAKAGDETALQAASEAWSANADEIAAFLHGANPDNWPEDVLAHEMHMHLELTLREVEAHLSGDYAAGIAAYDEVHYHILHMADLLSDGIASQFSERFAS